MTLKSYTAGAFRSPKDLRVRSGGAIRTAKRGRVFAAAAWREFYVQENPINITIFPSPVTSQPSVNPAYLDALVSAFVAGGTSPFTYVWSVVSFDTPSMPTISNGTTASPTFRALGIVPGDTHGAIFRVTIADNLGLTATKDVIATFTRTE
jgi:hypothetical protein